MIKLALYGDNASGKTTCARLIKDIAKDHGQNVEIVKMAAPLYELQAQVYKLANQPLVDKNQQDERLLSTLAAEIRRINPRALHEYVVQRLESISQRSKEGQCLVVVEDSRPVDRSNLEELGFVFLHIWADLSTRQCRVRLRGDIPSDTFSDSDMATIGDDDVLKNTADLKCLRDEVSGVLRKLLQT